MSQSPALARYWHPMGFASAVGAGPVRRVLLDVPYVLWRSADGIRAAVDRCPHRDAALSAGWVSNDRLVCPYHGWEYGASGRACHIPQAPGRPIPPRAQLDTLQVEERYGIVWGCPGDAVPPPLPDIPEFGADGWRLIPEYEWRFGCSAAHLIENNFDPGHVAFVHRGTFGDPSMAALEPGKVERIPGGLRSVNELRVDNRPGDDRPSVRRTTAELHVPFFAVFRICYPDGLVHIMVKACRPAGDRATSLLQFVIRNDTEADMPATSILAFDDAVEREDQAILDQMPADYPLDPAAQVHIASDRPAIALRRLYRETLGDRAPQLLSAGAEASVAAGPAVGAEPPVGVGPPVAAEPSGGAGQPGSAGQPVSATA